MDQIKIALEMSLPTCRGKRWTSFDQAIAPSMYPK